MHAHIDLNQPKITKINVSPKIIKEGPVKVERIVSSNDNLIEIPQEKKEIDVKCVPNVKSGKMSPCLKMSK